VRTTMRLTSVARGGAIGRPQLVHRPTRLGVLTGCAGSWAADQRAIIERKWRNVTP
jgi:hypothetical protein